MAFQDDRGLGAALRPPDGLLQRWRFYSSRYGRLHAALRFIGTRAPAAWLLIGPFATAGFLRRWRASGGPKIVNLGGGGNCLQGCLTADIDPRADVYIDLRQALPFNDGEVDLIFCEEAIEHVDKAVAFRLLQECHRVLKRDGILRVTTPNLDWMIGALMAGELSCDDFNLCFYGHGHRYLYRRSELEALLRQAGFASVKLSRYQDPDSCLGVLDSHAERFRHDPELSQYQDAFKLQ